jgi:o-succinylbenzoate synthase
MPPHEDDLLVWSIPMRTRFRGIDVREGVLVRGPSGWGEFSPFWDYDAAESAPWWHAAHEAAYGAWPAPRRASVPVNLTVPAVSPELASAIVRDSKGCRTAKVKVAEPGQAPADDLARVEAVRDALGPGGFVRVDANGLWDVDTAVRTVRLLDRAAGGLEYVEQPCRTVEELAAVRRLVDVPVAADESIRRADDPLRVARLEAADIAVLKVQPLGGVAACLRIAEQIGLPVVVSSALETSVGIAAGLALAAALPELPYACGLATLALLDGDVTSAPFAVVDGALAVGRPEPDLAAAVAADGATSRRWRERLAGVTRVLP